jgi:phosphate transport system substrate-binding protein
LLGIEGDKGALGYVPYAYFAPRAGKTMKAVKIDAGNGPVAPSPQTVKDASYKPLSRPLFIYVNRKAADRAEVKRFVEFYLKNGEKMAEVVGYIPLNASDYPKVLERFNKLQMGTSFGGGSSEGKTLEDILSTAPEA